MQTIATVVNNNSELSDSKNRHMLHSLIFYTVPGPIDYIYNKFICIMANKPVIIHLKPNLTELNFEFHEISILPDTKSRIDDF